MSGSTKTAAAIVPLVVAAVLSCDVVDERVETDAPQMAAWCDSSADCMSDLVCDEEIHLCVFPSPVKVNAWLRLVPPESSISAVEEQYPEMSLHSQKPVTLTLNLPVKVVGRVILKGDDLKGSEVADIVAVADGEIPDLQIEAYSLASQVVSDEMGMAKAGFEFLVSQDKLYDVHVYLADVAGGAQIPPYHVRRKFAPDQSLADPYVVEWNVEVPPVEQYREITGRIVGATGGKKPWSGVTVYASSQQTGNQSTVAETDSDGRFSIRVQPPASDPGSDLYDLRIAASAANEMVPAAVLTQVLIQDDSSAVPSEEDAEEDGVPQAAEVEDLGNLEIEGFGSAESVAVEVAGGNGAFEPASLAGTVVRITGKVGPGLLQLERVLDAAGAAAFSVPPANYVVSVLPPAVAVSGEAQQYGIFQQAIQVYPRDEVFLVKAGLSAMPELHGDIVAPDGGPVVDAHIQATYTGKGEYPEVPLPTREYSTDSDESGRYVLRLDPGQYTLVVDAPLVAGLPRLVQREVYVGKSQQRSFEIPPPSAVSGTIVGYGSVQAAASKSAPASGGASPAPEVYGDMEQGPMPGVRVEMYDKFDAKDGTDGTMPIPVATGYTDAEGKFVLVVPAK